jgi:hypothetical protein
LCGPEAVLRSVAMSSTLSRWVAVGVVGLLLLLSACAGNSGTGSGSTLSTTPSSPTSTRGATYTNDKLGTYCLPASGVPKGLKPNSSTPTVSGLPVAGYEMQGGSGFQTSGPTSLPPTTTVWYESFIRASGSTGATYSLDCEAFLFVDATTASAAMPTLKTSIATFNGYGGKAATLKDLASPGLGDESFAVTTGTPPTFDATSIVWRKGSLVVELDVSNQPIGGGSGGNPMTLTQLKALAVSVDAMSG